MASTTSPLPFYQAPSTQTRASQPPYPCLTFVIWEEIWLKALVGWAKINQAIHSSILEMEDDGPCSHCNTTVRVAPVISISALGPKCLDV